MQQNTQINSQRTTTSNTQYRLFFNKSLHEMNHSAEKARKKTFLKNLRFVEKEH